VFFLPLPFLILDSENTKGLQIGNQHVPGKPIETAVVLPATDFTWAKAKQSFYLFYATFKMNGERSSAVAKKGWTALLARPS
jgi:hypothetical protein